MGDSHFCKWEFGAPKEYSEKPIKPKKKEKAQTSITTNPQHWSRKCFSGHWSVWAVPVSVCFCSGLCTELCLSPSFLSQTLSFLCWASYWILVILLWLPSMQSLCQSLCQPCYQHCHLNAWNIPWAGDRFPVTPCQGLWVCCLRAAGGTVLSAHSKTERYWAVFSLQELLQ